jgi:hypothetical protein
MSRPILIVPEVLLATPVAALVASVPAALRLVTDRSGFFEAWFAVAGLLCPLLLLGIAIARGARRTLHTLAPDAVVAMFVGASLWALASLPATAILAALLKATTHHRPLGGATFATFALAVHAASALFAWRVTALVLRRFRPAARTGLAVVLALAALVLVFITVSGGASANDAQPASGSAAHLPALLVDGILALAAAAVASVLDVPEGKASAASWLGAGALAFVALAGVVVAARSPSVAGRLADQAPLAGVVGDAIGLASAR